MKPTTQAPNLYEALGFAPNPREEMTASERHRETVIIETLVKCMTNPTIFAADATSSIPPPHDFLQKNRPLIEAERMARLHHLLNDKPDASLDEIRACATTLTNYEICGILSVLSGLAPLPREHVAEYIRAFAHCFSFDKVTSIFGIMSGDIINLHDVERFYQLFGGRKGFGFLDDRERKWIRDFNKKMRDRSKGR